jgi:hypothetical protein
MAKVKITKKLDVFAQMKSRKNKKHQGTKIGSILALKAALIY